MVLVMFSLRLLVYGYLLCSCSPSSSSAQAFDVLSRSLTYVSHFATPTSYSYCPPVAILPYPTVPLLSSERALTLSP